MKWPDILAAALRPALRVLLIALLGALADAGLLDGAVGELPGRLVSSFRSSAEAAALLHRPQAWDRRLQCLSVPGCKLPV